MINTRKILLTPEIGDWTEYVPQKEDEAVVIGSVGVSNFDRLSSEQLYESHKIHYNCLEKICVNIQDSLRLKVNLYKVEAIQQSYQNFKDSIDETYVQVSVLVEDKYPFKVYVQKNMASILVDRGVGGTGEPDQEALSEIEQKVFERIVAQLMESFIPFWNIADLSSVKIEEVSNSVNQDLSLSPQSSYIAFKSKLSLGNNEAGEILFGYSQDSILELNARSKIGGALNKARNIILKPKTQEKIGLDVKVDIGSAEITMKELMNLREGDIIKLDTRLDNYLKGTIGDKLYFQCFPGEHNEKKAVRVLNIYNKLQNADEGTSSDFMIEKQENVSQVQTSPVTEDEAQDISSNEEYVIEESQPIIKDVEQDEVVDEVEDTPQAEIDNLSGESEEVNQFDDELGSVEDNFEDEETIEPEMEVSSTGEEASFEQEDTLEETADFESDEDDFSWDEDL